MPLKKIHAFNQHAQEYDQWFDQNPNVFLSELNALKKVAPLNGDALEIGVGSGRFAAALGIPFGLDPSEELLKIAKSRGIVGYHGVAESLPFLDHRFDTVFFITALCFVDNPIKALFEAKRVLKEHGVLIIAIIDRNSALGKSYEVNKKNSPYYQYANFSSVHEIETLLKKVGFKMNDTYQTIFSPITKTTKVEPTNPGHGKGGFVVIRAQKNCILSR